MDISNKEITINYDVFRQASGYYFLYKEYYGKEPETIPIGNDTITSVRFKDMLSRVKGFVLKEGLPKIVWIVKPKPTVTKSAYHLAEEKALGKTYENFTQWYGHMIGRGYAGYRNDVNTPTQERSNIAKHIAMNCTDYTQHAKEVANDMGYMFQYIHIKCKVSGMGHVYGMIKGKEFKDWVKVDVAAAASVGSKYPIGKVWCSDSTPVVSHELWLTQNDGR